MPKSVLEKIAAGEVVSKEECQRSVNTHVSNYKSLLERFENDNKLFGDTQDETFKNICQNDVTACQNKQNKLNDMVEHLTARLDDTVAGDVTVKTEAEKKMNDGENRLAAAKVVFTENLAKFNKNKEDREKARLETLRNTSGERQFFCCNCRSETSKIDLELEHWRILQLGEVGRVLRRRLPSV